MIEIEVNSPKSSSEFGTIKAAIELHGIHYYGSRVLTFH
jgi:hypothetical protein